MSARNKVYVCYHVTAVPKEDPQPTGDLLAFPADSDYFAGKLLGKKCVFLATTQYQRGLPTKSIYPKDGDSGTHYWRVQIPLSRFNGYEIRFVNHVDKQVLLLLSQPEIDDQIASKFKILSEPNEYLWRDEDNNWYTNDYYVPRKPWASASDYDDDDQKYFVNVAVLDDVSTEDCDWDRVQHF